MIQVNEHVSVMKERQDFYENNNFTDLFSVAAEIALKKDRINEGIQQIITNQTKKVNGLVSDEEKQQWHSDTLIQLHTVNQMLLGLMVEMGKRFDMH